MDPDKTRAVLIGGIISGILSIIPFLNMCNCCCLWVLAGGMISAYMLAKANPASNGGDGAIVGAGAGLVAGCLYAVFAILQYLLIGEKQMDMMFESIRQLTSQPGADPQMAQQIQEMEELIRSTGALFPILGAILSIPIFVGVSAIGGLLGMSLFNKQPPGGGYYPGQGYPPGYGPQGYPPQYQYGQYQSPPGQSRYAAAAQTPGYYPPPPPPSAAGPESEPMSWGAPKGGPGDQGGDQGRDDIFGGGSGGGEDPK